jgi:hypothetical protein
MIPVTRNFVSRRERAKKLLQDTAEFLNEGDEESRHFWNVLSALRGPDEPNSDEMKMATTAKIRKAIGMDSQNQMFAVVAWEKPRDIITHEHLSAAFPTAHFHFVDHAVRAFRALDFFGFLKSEK